MKVGVVKEIKPDEYRVALTPEGAYELAGKGHTILVETEAGSGAMITDAEYEAAGALVVSADRAWSEAELLLKVKEPIASEYRRLHAGQIIFTYLHLAADEPLTRALLSSQATAVAYETIEDESGNLPLLAPMSEVAGRLATQIGASLLERTSGGRGLLLGGVAGVAPGQVLIIGGGRVGSNAAKVAIGLGARVTILDRSIDRIRMLDDLFGGRATILRSSAMELERALAEADLVIGGVLVPGARAPRLVTREMLGSMRPGTVLIDVAIDQGGCFETSRPTTHTDPTYVVDDVVHYCVSNMPGCVPITATNALTSVTLPYIEHIADQGLLAAATSDRSVARGINVLEGKLTNAAIATAHNLDYSLVNHSETRATARGPR